MTSSACWTVPYYAPVPVTVNTLCQVSTNLRTEDGTVLPVGPRRTSQYVCHGRQDGRMGISENSQTGHRLSSPWSQRHRSVWFTSRIKKHVTVVVSVKLTFNGDGGPISSLTVTQPQGSRPLAPHTCGLTMSLPSQTFQLGDMEGG